MENTVKIMIGVVLSGLVFSFPGLAFAAPTHSLTIESAPFAGMWTTLKTADGQTTLASGYTPITFELESGIEYQVTVANFGKIKFEQWGDGTASIQDWGARYNLVIYEDTVITANYDVKGEGKNWQLAHAFAASIIASGLNETNIPEVLDMRLYDATGGKLGFNFESIMHGYQLVHGHYGWCELTDGQVVWLLQNFEQLTAGGLS